MAIAFRFRPRRHFGLTLGAFLTGFVVLVALVSLFWTPYHPTQQNPPLRFQPPGSALHWLGTDHYGRDMLSLVMAGAQNSLAIAALAVALGLAIGLPLGLAAAALKGWWEEGIGRAVDLTFAFPAILTAAMVTALYGPGGLNVVIAVGVFNAAVFARVARGAALQIYGREFVRAALALGRSRLAIAARHVLPNMAPVLIVQVTIQFALAILAEAALSYLGVGTTPPTPSWGKMLFDAQSFIFNDWRQPLWPGLAIAISVLGFNLLGDGLRDLLDPRLSALPAR